MKQFLFSLLLIITIGATAQTPQAINYQAVARNAQGQALASQAIKVRLSIVSSASGNPTLYSETRSVTTNVLGLFNVQIGGPGALSTTGSFTGIDWVHTTGAAKSLKVELDINNSGAFTDMGTQSLVTVPYAFAADEAVNAAHIGGKPISGQAPKTGDILRWDGSSWTPGSPVKIYRIASYLGNKTYPGGGVAYKVIGDTLEVTFTAGQTVTILMTATIGSTSNINQILTAPVYLQPSDNSLRPLEGIFTHTASLVADKKTTITVTSTFNVVPGGNPGNGSMAPGTYKIGLGVLNSSVYPLDRNGNITGFIMIQ